MSRVTFSQRVHRAISVDYDHTSHRYRVLVHHAPPGLAVVLPRVGRGVFSFHPTRTEADVVCERLRAVMTDIVAEAVREEMAVRAECGK